MPKQKLTLSVDKEIINNAKKIGINLSSFLEIRLIDYIYDKEKCSRRDSLLIVQCSLIIYFVYLYKFLQLIMLQNGNKCQIKCFKEKLESIT